jgi:hypothetical protein
MEELEVQSWKDLGIIFDTRSASARSKHSIIPPPMMVLNAQGERIPFVFYLDTKTGRIGHYKYRKDEEAKEFYLTLEFDETMKVKNVVQEWITVPNYKVKFLLDMRTSYKKQLKDKGDAR